MVNFQHHGQLIGLIKPRTSHLILLNQSSLNTNQTCSFITSFANTLTLPLVALTMMHRAKVGPVCILSLWLQSTGAHLQLLPHTHTNTHTTLWLPAAVRVSCYTHAS